MLGRRLAMAAAQAVEEDIGGEESGRIAETRRPIDEAFSHERIDCYAGLLGCPFVGGSLSETVALHSVSGTGDCPPMRGSSSFPELFVRRKGLPKAKSWTCRSETRWKGYFKAPGLEGRSQVQALGGMTLIG